MFKRVSALVVLACLSGATVAQVPDQVVIQPDPVVPFPIYSTDPDTPPGPTNLNATSNELGSWTVTWDVPVDENDDPVAVDNYTVYWLDGSGAWQELTVDDAYREAQIGTIEGVATVTVIANLDDEPSAAWEYLALQGVDNGPIFPCPVLRLRVQPPPPGGWVDPRCIPD